ncbi:hypothetical protein LZL87_007677 [Fusarium oxysporum]|nr:hypothetical protein LZL87_007677 [Fusarium oxysporum]
MAPLINFVGQKLVDLYKYDLERADIDAVVRTPYEIERWLCDQNVANRGPYTQSPLDKNDVELVKLDVTAENYEPRIGDRFKGKINQNLQPSQHIYRRPTGVKKTEENKETWSPIEVELDNDWSHPYPPRAGDGNLPYWSHYDLLGLFLSLMGPAEYNSDRFNFFLPLTAVYARWCFTIAGNRNRKKLKSSQVMAFKPRPGYGKPPTIFQCTWITGTDSKVDFSLGASMGGQHYGSIDKETGENKLGKWSERLQRSRFDLLKEWNAIEGEKWINQKGEEEPFAFETSPGIDSGNDDLWEDYSLAKIHIEAEKKREDEKISYKWIWSPCRNCKYLIKVASAELDNFLPEKNRPTEENLKEGEGPKAGAKVKENGHLVSA